MPEKSARAYIGTSGWHYDHWKGTFYPGDIRTEDMLAHLSGRLSAVEINNTFYQLPAEGTLSSWADTVPRDFVFCVKASRYVTHMKKLKDPDRTLPNLLERVDELGNRLGAVLFQLPPNWRANVDRLRSFLEALPKGMKCAFEFRDESWFNDSVYQALADYNAAFCIYDMEGRQTPRKICADFVYIRLHGPSERKYQGSYGNEELSGWAGAISAWTRAGRDVYCFFDNDQEGHAANNAVSLAGMLSSHG
ncbi:MAG: DUF72 domain-containing protein [Desulfatibacillaceae bacterium]